MSDSDRKIRERRLAERLTRQVLKFLEEEIAWEIRFADLSDPRLLARFGFGSPVVGALISDEYAIYVDPSFRDIFRVIIHECLHAVDMEATEGQILWRENLVRRHLTPRQARNLLLYAARRLR